MSDLLACLEESQALIRDMSEEVQALDRELRPFWAREKAIKDAIRESYAVHNGRITVALGSSEAWRIEMRKGLYAELDRLSEVFGPIRTRRRETRADLDASMRQVERLHELISNPPTTGSGKSAQLRLF